MAKVPCRPGVYTLCNKFILQYLLNKSKGIGKNHPQLSRLRR